MDPITAARLWLMFRPIQKIKAMRQRRRRLRELGIEDEGVSMFPKGTQTLTGIAVLVLVPWAAKYGISSEEVTAWVTALGTVVGGAIAVLGYLRRKKLPAE
jgi:uncharacterized membrane protein YphA (DoxX/SURF4 family)